MEEQIILRNINLFYEMFEWCHDKHLDDTQDNDIQRCDTLRLCIKHTAKRHLVEEHLA